MTDLETMIADKILKDNLLKLHIRYVDDTLALIKESDNVTVLHKVDSYRDS